MAAKKSSKKSKARKGPPRPSRRQSEGKQDRAQPNARTRLGDPARSRFVAALMKKYESLTYEAADEAAFHLLDWEDDLYRLARVIDNPDEFTDNEIVRAIMEFTCHAPDHVAAAHLILFDLPVQDTFELGAVKGTGKPRRKPGGPYPEDTCKTLKPKRKTRKA